MGSLEGDRPLFEHRLDLAEEPLDMMGTVDDLDDDRHLLGKRPGVLLQDGAVGPQAHEAFQDRRALQAPLVRGLHNPLVQRLGVMAHEVRELEPAENLLGLDFRRLPPV